MGHLSGGVHEECGTVFQLANDGRLVAPDSDGSGANLARRTRRVCKSTSLEPSVSAGCPMRVIRDARSDEGTEPCVFRRITSGGRCAGLSFVGENEAQKARYGNAHEP